MVFTNFAVCWNYYKYNMYAEHGFCFVKEMNLLLCLCDIFMCVKWNAHMLTLQRSQAMVLMFCVMVTDWRQMAYQSMLRLQLLMLSWMFIKLRHLARGYCTLYQPCLLNIRNRSECHFFTHDSIYAIARICHANSVCQSVCCACFVSKRLNASSKFFHHLIHYSSFLPPRVVAQIWRLVPQRGRQIQVGSKNWQFSSNMRL